jgi:phosphomannomutase/phosphoglucomutase
MAASRTIIRTRPTCTTCDDLILAVKQTNADLGLAFDGDGDRLGVVTRARVTSIFPDRLLMLFAMDVLSRNPARSHHLRREMHRALCRTHPAHGGSPMMWKTGHSLIKAKMREEESAQLAGEMSGHFFFAERWYGFDDGIYAAARLLEILAGIATRRRTAGEILATLPKGVSTPELKIPNCVEGEHYAVHRALQGERAKFPKARKPDHHRRRARRLVKDGWGLVRASNTTPCLVLRFDALNKIGLDRIQESFRGQLLAVDPNLNLPF